MRHRKHSELPKTQTGHVFSMPVKLKSWSRHVCPACEPFLDPKEIVKGIFHWSEEKWNSLWNATKASWSKKSQQRIDIWSIVTEELWKTEFYLLESKQHHLKHTQCAPFSGVLETLHIKLKITISFRAVFNWYWPLPNSLHNNKEIYEV